MPEACFQHDAPSLVLISRKPPVGSHAAYAGNPAFKPSARPARQTSSAGIAASVRRPRFRVVRKCSAGAVFEAEGHCIMKTFIIAATALALTAGAAHAGTPWINKRQKAQHHSIYNGIANGRLTYGEASRLVHGQNRVRAMQARAKSDGVVTAFERLKLHTALTWQRARIYHLKHN